MFDQGSQPAAFVSFYVFSFTLAALFIIAPTEQINDVFSRLTKLLKLLVYSNVLQSYSVHLQFTAILFVC